METSPHEIREKVPASRKLQADDARELLNDSDHLIAIKGKKIQQFDTRKTVPEDAVTAMLGPTGNLRAPTLRLGKTLIVGFNQTVFEEQLS